jgi:hypothetical protein
VRRLRRVQQVALGCARLEEAACALREAGQPPVAPVLEAEIAEALADLKPACTLEHLQARSSSSFSTPSEFGLALILTRICPQAWPCASAPLYVPETAGPFHSASLRPLLRLACILSACLHPCQMHVFDEAAVGPP